MVSIIGVFVWSGWLVLALLAVVVVGRVPSLLVVVGVGRAPSLVAVVAVVQVLLMNQQAVVPVLRI